MPSVDQVPAFYARLGPQDYRPSISVQGAWRDDEQHMAPLSGLMTEALIRHEAREGMRIARLSFEILGLIPLTDTHIEVRTIRPGRTIELLEADASVAGRIVVRARAWRLMLTDTADVAGNELPMMPKPQDCVDYAIGGTEWGGAFIASLEWRMVPGGREGRRGVWVRSAADLLQDESVDSISSFVMLVDAANGSATRARPTELMYPNVDLGIHLLRAPDPSWVGLDVAVSFGTDGIGLTCTTLNDGAGPVGRAEQILTVRHFPDCPRVPRSAQQLPNEQHTDREHRTDQFVDHVVLAGVEQRHGHQQRVTREQALDPPARAEEEETRREHRERLMQRRHGSDQVGLGLTEGDGLGEEPQVQQVPAVAGIPANGSAGDVPLLRGQPGWGHREDEVRCEADRRQRQHAVHPGAEAVPPPDPQRDRHEGRDQEVAGVAEAEEDRVPPGLSDLVQVRLQPLGGQGAPEERAVDVDRELRVQVGTDDVSSAVARDEPAVVVLAREASTEVVDQENALERQPVQQHPPERPPAPADAGTGEPGHDPEGDADAVQR